jgi:hypothetical protein
MTFLPLRHTAMQIWRHHLVSENNWYGAPEFRMPKHVHKATVFVLELRWKLPFEIKYLVLPIGSPMFSIWGGITAEQFHTLTSCL